MACIADSWNYGMDYTRPEALKTTKNLVKQIKTAQKTFPNAHFVVTGRSGIAAAWAALMFHDFPLYMVRKEVDKNNSHGSLIEGPQGELEDYFIIDDFVSSGNTVQRIIQTIKTKCEREDEDIIPKCLGFIGYSPGHDGPSMPSYIANHAIHDASAMILLAHRDKK